MIDAHRPATANPDAKLVELAEVNHVLKQVASADRAANLATYAATGLPLAPTVIPAIRMFIGQSR